MKMLTNMKIGVRLGLGFGVVSLLMAAIAALGITRLSLVSEQLELVANDRYPKTVLANSVIDQAGLIARVLRNLYILDGSDQLEKERELLDAIVPTIAKTSDLVQEIAAASGERSSGVGQINAAMSQLSQTTQQNASASEELAATAEEMSGQAEQLQDMMRFFKTGKEATRPAASMPERTTAGLKVVPGPAFKRPPVPTQAPASRPEFVNF